MNTKNLICYLKTNVFNTGQVHTNALISGLLQKPLDGEPVEIWKRTGLQLIPPPGCEFEMGPKTGYNKVKNIYIREYPKAMVICINLEDSLFHPLETFLTEGWKKWERGDIKKLSKL